MTGRKVTANPTYWVALVAARNEVLVNERQSLKLVRGRWLIALPVETASISESESERKRRVVGKPQFWQS